MRAVRQARVGGPLAPLAAGFGVELARLGYTPASAQRKLYEMARLSRWLEARGLTAGDVDEGRVEAALADQRATAGGHVPTLAAMRPLLEWMRAEGVIGTRLASQRDIHAELLERYRRWMVAERGLAARTVDRYEKTARRFLAEQAVTAGGLGVEGLTAAGVTGFLSLEVGRGLAVGSMQGRVAELRSLLRFLYLQGLTGLPLAEAVPPVPGWKLAAVPPGRLSAEQVTAIIDGCEGDKAKGRRDRAMLLLLARLGLRAAEVARLGLGDLDWRAGEIVVRGKARRPDRMPLPDDVGEAVAAYLTGSRPRVEQRAVFLTVVAPFRPLVPTAVSEMVYDRCAQAGVPGLRAHRFRYALATSLLDRGVRLPEIAVVLRQRDLATTAIYAKVDYKALRALALAWPETAR